MLWLLYVVLYAITVHPRKNRPPGREIRKYEEERKKNMFAGCSCLDQATVSSDVRLSRSFASGKSVRGFSIDSYSTVPIPRILSQKCSSHTELQQLARDPKLQLDNLSTEAEKCPPIRTVQ